MAGWLDGWLAGWLAGWVDGWLAGWVDGWLDGWLGEMDAAGSNPRESRLQDSPMLCITLLSEV